MAFLAWTLVVFAAISVQFSSRAKSDHDDERCLPNRPKAEDDNLRSRLKETSLACMDRACSDVNSSVPMPMLRNSWPCQLGRIIPTGE